MIYDSLENFNDYLSVYKNLNLIPEFFKQNPIKSLDSGRYEMENDSYAIVNKYLTKDISECFMECHRKFIDVQIMLSGKEKIGICNKKHCKESKYDEEKDFSKLEGDTDFITLKSGEFAIFFPQDGHMPSIKHDNDSQQVMKVVFKIPV